MNSIFTRTSIRKYTEQEVEADKIELLLKAAMAAPSAGNQQPWEFYVVRDKSLLIELSKSTPYAGASANAPVAIVSCYRKELLVPQCVESDMGACMENILLEAEELGLGAVWLGVAPFQDRIEQIGSMLNISENLKVYSIIAIGYPLSKNKQQNRFDEQRIHYIG